MKCDSKGCKNEWCWVLKLNKGAKKVELRLCSQCAVKIVKRVKGGEL